MSRITLAPNASGTGALTIAAPNTNTDRTLTLPDVTTTLVGTDATQTLTNKSIAASQLTGALPAIDGSALTGVNTALAFISSATISNVATVDFTGFDASKYSDYVFSLSNVIPVTDGVTLQFRMSVDGGSTFLTSYGSCIQYTGSTVNAANTASAGTHIPITDGNSVGSDVNEFGVSGEVRVFGPDLVARTYMTGFVRATNTAGTNQIGISVGQNEVTTAVNAVRFLFSSGNLESGRITMYGVRKS
jgi:hypothetical protein